MGGIIRRVFLIAIACEHRRAPSGSASIAIRSARVHQFPTMRKPVPSNLYAA